MNQLSLFDRPQLPPAQPVSTSIDAAKAIQPHVSRLQRKVLGFIASAVAAGATRNEIAAGLDMRIQTVCGRCHELLDGKYIYQSDERRDGGKVLRATRSGEHSHKEASE